MLITCLGCLLCVMMQQWSTESDVEKERRGGVEIGEEEREMKRRNKENMMVNVI